MMRLVYGIALLLLSWPVSCLTANAAEAPAEASAEIARLQELRGPAGKAKTDVEGLRDKVVQEAAFTLGVQRGAAWRQTRRIAALEGQADTLNQMFNFGLLLLDGDVLPPVIAEAGPGLRLENEQTAVSVIKHFKIISDASIVSVPPSWRNYLALPFDDAEVAQINPLVLPKTQAERDLWHANVQKGFYAGIRQADQVFEASLNRLVRDFCGLIRFHTLVRQGVVAMPHINRGQFDITVDGKELRIGERIFRVTGTVFQRVEAWKPR